MRVRRPLRDQAGLTLVEVAVALGILALVMVLGMPSLQGWQDKIDVRNSVEGIADALLTARTRAVVERRVYTLTVDYAGETLAVAPAGGPVRVPGGVDLHADASDPDCPSLSAQDLVFRPNGTADAAGFEAVYVRSTNPAVAVRYRVKVLGATGKVSVERQEGGAWLGAF